MESSVPVQIRVGTLAKRGLDPLSGLPRNKQKPCYTFGMDKQKGFGLIFLVVSIALIAFVIYIYFSSGTYKSADNDKSVFEQQTEAIQQAENIKEILEEKSKIE